MCESRTRVARLRGELPGPLEEHDRVLLAGVEPAIVRLENAEPIPRQEHGDARRNRTDPLLVCSKLSAPVLRVIAGSPLRLHSRMQAQQRFPWCS